VSRIVHGTSTAGSSQNPSTNVEAPARIVLGTNMVGLNHIPSTNGTAVAKVVLGMSMVGLNPLGISDVDKSAHGMNMAVLNQNPTEAGVEIGKAIMPAANGKAAAMRAGGRANPVTELNGRVEVDQVLVMEMTTTTGLMNG